MVSPGELRLISTVCNQSSSEIKPVISEEGVVRYPFVNDVVDKQDFPVIEMLDALASNEILTKSYIKKSYICQSCNSQEMEYSRACPICETTHTAGRVIASHDDCDHSGPAAEFERNGGEQVCQGCNRTVTRSDLSYEERHFCRECDSAFSTPQHRLRCQNCRSSYLPKQLPERVLYEYSISEYGHTWYRTQTTAKARAKERLRENKYAVEEDTVVSTNGDSYPVHLYGEDTTFDTRVVVGLHDAARGLDLEYLCTTAESVGAHPLVVVTYQPVPHQALEKCETNDISVLAVQEDGSLAKDFAVTPEQPEQIDSQ